MFKILAAAASAAVFAVGAAAQAPPSISRASLAKTARFTITQTFAPTGGAKSTQVMHVEIKGGQARLEMNNPQVGAVTYLANPRGVFLYMPTAKIAQKQSLPEGASVEGFLRRAFGQINRQLRTAQKVGTATVSGQPTDVYKDARSGTQIYIGRNPGFRLPVKVTAKNAGGTRTLLVSNIKTNIALADARFAVPPGVRVIEASGGAGVPGGGGF